MTASTNQPGPRDKSQPGMLYSEFPAIILLFIFGILFGRSAFFVIPRQLTALPIRFSLGKRPQVVVISAIIGNYEKTAKPYAKQVYETDFIMFTDNVCLKNNGNWTVDRVPYHTTNASPLDNGSFRNSLRNNHHSFNIAKYYKQQFHLIPRLAKYDIIIWLDATRAPATANFTTIILHKMKQFSSAILAFEHTIRMGSLKDEVRASHFFRYTSTFWEGQAQPYQDIDAQYKYYLDQGYPEAHLSRVGLPYRDSNKTLGVWKTGVMAFNMSDPIVRPFLNEWYLQTLNFTTQDQVSFPYLCWKFSIIPYTIPDKWHSEAHLVRAWPHFQ